MSPSTRTPLDLALPYREWRPGQRLAARTAVSSKRSHVVIQAPTGAGKSLIAAAITRLQPTKRTVTLTATNGLLSQYATLFSHFAPIKGAGNYECLAAVDEHRRYFRLVAHPHDVRCDDGPCQSGIACSLKEDGCTYFDARRRAFASATPLTNYAYWLAMRRYAGGLGSADCLIADEAHALPEQLMAASRIELSRAARSGFWSQTVAGWRSWAQARLKTLKDQSAEDEDHRVRMQKAGETYRALATIDETWAWDKQRHGGVVFEPTIPRLLFPALADADTRVVYLSATITPAMLALLDIAPRDVETLVLTSRFPITRRPIYLVRTARVDYKMEGFAKEYVVRQIDRFIAKRLDRKGIILPTSYNGPLLSQAQFKKLSAHAGIMLAPSSAELTTTIEAFKAMPPPAILVSPAIEQGYDFPYEECEYIVIPKVPFPDTRSAIMRARVDGTDRYRDHLTMTRLVQGAGRGMRNDDDSCEVAIFDDHARWFITQNLDLAPQSFLDALVWTTTLPPPLPKLT